MKSKTLATWLAIAGGAFGLHRFYLFGWRDAWGWLYPWPTLLGLYGVHRVRELGHDDRLAWVLLPIGGVAIALAMLSALVYGLTPDERWDSRFHAAPGTTKTGWGAVLGVVLALMLGAGVLMASLAYSGQRYFEYQMEEARRISRQS
jgi:hypothetical protein